MLTFLDDWVRAIASGLEAMDPKGSERFKKVYGLKTDLDVVRKQVAHHNADLDIEGDRPRMVEVRLDVSSEWKTTTRKKGVDVSEVLEPFLTGRGHNLCLQIDPDLASLFAHAKIEDRQRQFEAFIAGYDNLYIDFPRGAYRYADDYEIRAVVMRRTGNRWVVFVALSAAGLGRLDLTQLLELFFTWGERTLTLTKRVEDAAFSPSVFNEQLEDLIRLAVLYYKSESESRQKAVELGKLSEYEEVAEPLPYVDVKQLEVLPDKKQQAKQKTHSMFRIIRMRPPRSRFERKASEATKGGWQLGVRVEVDAYFRMQPYGHKKTFRRLQLIGGYVKNPDAEKPQDMFLLQPKE